ncbi:hypothetical protein FOH38_12270 [Lysinibacillus fusiformis]|nr:hypothetical protein FOH38_12270 [Lysinibacillus fusiformis]
MTNKKTEKEKEKENNWTNRDWFWLLGILIGIIILLIASIFAKSLKIETNFSIISSAVSIALALVAIFFALKQDSDNQRVNDNVSRILNNIVSEMGVVKHQVNKISDKDIADIKEDTMADVKKDIEKESYTQEEVNEIVKKAVDEFSSKFKEMTNNNSVNNDALVSNPVFIRLIQEIRQDLINENGGYSHRQINRVFESKFGYKLPLDVINKILNGS